ncbi:MAG: 2-oxoglutarate dehydrogenase complex dihydrolipoyllysine-residue succinyltransferase [Planctomycetota bacterium]|jgi:2-oxoglutarate dehydrogenase E2 component (dihydrolipoamide succinyltransferase)
MAIELKVPEVGESVTEVQIGSWLKNEGDGIASDEALVEIESDKATVEVPAPTSGVVTKILKQAGEMAEVGEVIALLEEGEAPASSGSAASAPAEQVATAAAAAGGGQGGATHVMPAAARALATEGVAAADVRATGPGGRMLKEDVQRAAAAPQQTEAPDAPMPRPAGSRDEEVVPMSMLRRRIADNLVKAQQTAALLTTFNEIDMTAVMALRKEYKDSFADRYGIKLGFMSFFVKAAVDALKLVPAVNAEVRGDQIVYKHYNDVGIAVGGGRGLVVPVLRNAESLSFAEVELSIADFGRRAKDNKLAMDELTGGTFTISNGGVYGSLLSTPIVNPPQSGILGLHAIQERPVAINGQVEVRPMMYVALTYDHRLVDGREAVTFLKRIKECVENPQRMLLEV